MRAYHPIKFHSMQSGKNVVITSPSKPY